MIASTCCLMSRRPISNSETLSFSSLRYVWAAIADSCLTGDNIAVLIIIFHRIFRSTTEQFLKSILEINS